MPRRENPYTYPEIARERIKSGRVLKRLLDHVLGTDELSSTQIRAAEILLKKTVPDLRQTEITGVLEQVVQHKITLEPHGPDD